MCGYTYRLRRRGPTTNTSELRTTAVCPRTAGQGTKHPNKGFCDYHEVKSRIEIEGNSQRAKTRSRKSQLQAALQVAAQNARFFGEYDPIGPHEALAQEVWRTNAIVTWLEEKLRRLRDDGTPEDDILRQYAKMGIEPSVWMVLFAQEREHLVRVTQAAIKAGVAERRQQLAEDQARLLAGVMLAFVHDMDLSLSPEQIMKAPAIIRKHMLALPQTENSPLDVEAVLAPEPPIPVNR